MHQLKHRRKIRESIDRERMHRIEPLTYSALGTTIDNYEFKAKGMDYLHQNCNEITTDAGLCYLK